MSEPTTPPDSDPDGAFYLHPRTILVVDDNAQNAELLAAYLAELPVNIVVARDGVEALDEMARHRADPVLLDVMMSRMSGLQLCRRLKGDPATRDVSVIMVTALNELADVEAARDAGCDDFVTKPVGRFELLARVKWLLDAHAPG
jgi:two-component system alkaline phosphatase synthesis response regulator PhoP